MYLYYKQRAFTLIELVITIAVLCIIATFTLPMYHKLQENLELNRVPALVRQQVALAKTQASTHHNTVVMCSSEHMEKCEINQWHNGIIIFSDINNNKALDNNEIIYSTLKTEIRYGTFRFINNATNTKNTLTFQGDTGLPRGAAGGFHYCSFNDKQQYNYYPVSPMGHVRIDKSDKCN